MSNLIPTPRKHEPVNRSRPRSGVVVDRRTGRALDQIEGSTVVRMASVQAHAMVQVEKTHEIDRLTREAMGGQAMLQRWSTTLSQGDPFLADELRLFTDLARMGKGEIIADTISNFCQEGGR